MKKLILFLAAFFGVVFGQTCPHPNTQLTGGTTITLTGASKSREVGTVGDFHYEVWHAANECTASNTMTYYGASQGGGAAFKANWNQGSTCDFLARIGYMFDEGKTYKEYGDLFADYNYTRSPHVSASSSVAGDYSYIGIYGWVRKTNTTRTVEWYIVDDWFGNQWQSDATPVGPNTICGGCSSLGTITVDGGTYDIYKHTRTDAYSIDADKDTFDQYFSVRKTPRKCGTISITEHFKKWEELELPMSGALYEAKLLAEAGGGTGWIDYRYATMRIGGTNSSSSGGAGTSSSSGGGGVSSSSGAGAPVQATNCNNFIGELPASPNPPELPYTACFKHSNNKCYVCKIDNEGSGNTCASTWVWDGNNVDDNLNVPASQGGPYWYYEVDCPEDPTPIKILHTIPAAKFQVRALGNKSLQVESNADATIYLYNTKGKMVQKIEVPAGASIVKLSVPQGIYIVKNKKQTQRVIVR